ncbi:transketolase-like TK C-terminal-containing protein, partial [Staphylococcus aureus]
AWEVAVEAESTPASLVLTGQNLPVLDVPEDVVEADVRNGAYTVYGAAATPEFLLLASGSEVSLAVEAAKDLEQQGKSARVVSMPHWHAFE